MAQSFNCPNCSGPLDYDGDDLTVRCPYCNSSVIVPESLRSTPAGAPSRAPSLPVVGMDTFLANAGQLKEVVRHIRSGNKIEAIRIYKETFNVSLADAKDAVDKLAAGQAVSLPGSAGSPAPAPGYASYSSNRVPMARAEISRLVRDGKKIEAIKVYRETFGTGLKESKEAVESFEAGGPLLEPAPGSPLSADYSSVSTTSSMTSTYTATNQPPRQGSFIAAWAGLSLVAFWIGFTVGMLSLFAFPGLVRLAAPVLCPDGYTDAYGERVFNYYDPQSNTSVDGAALLKCVDNEGQTTVANPLLVFVVMDAGTWMMGIALAFGLAAVSRFRLVGCLPLLGASFLIAVGLYFYITSIPAASRHNLGSWFFGASSETSSETTSETTTFTTTEVVSEPTSTPAFAPQTLAFGEGEGTGPGYFNDTRTIAVDGQGNIYTADYNGGRIQVFDAGGQFANTWKIAGENVYITGLAADRQGTLYVVYGGNIYRYEGSTGEALGRVDYDGSYVSDVAVTPFSELVAASASSIVRFDRDGNLEFSLDNWSEGLEGGGGALRVDNLAVDGEDNVYIADGNASTIYKFSPEGRFLDRVGAAGDAPGQFHGLYGLAFDGRGRLYALDYKGVQVFDKSGMYLGLIEIEGLGFDMTMSDHGDLFVMDRNANKVLKFKVTP